MISRITLIVGLALLGACANQGTPQLRDGLPGLGVARAALAGGTPDIALNVSNAILAHEPRNIPALLMRGDALSALSQPDDAAETYTNVLAIQPDSVGAKIGLGRLRLHSDPAQAQTLFSSVVMREPRNKIALNDLGIAYDLQGAHASAQGAYRQALAADPAMRAAEVNLALSLAVSGHAADAVQILRPLASRPGAARRVREDLAVALALAGNKSEAAQILRDDMTPEQIDAALMAYEALGL